MYTIYNKALSDVENGAKFEIDFCKRSLKVNGKYLIKKGKFDYVLKMRIDDASDFISCLESYYFFYKHSVPSERSESKSKKYFKALPESELSDIDMMYGIGRESAQFQLEAYILFQLLLGLKWDESWGKWFWQSTNDKDLILLRQWFE